MAAGLQDAVRDFLVKGKAGGLPPKEQAKAWALREAWRALGEADYGMVKFICERVAKSGSGGPVQPGSICDF